MTRTGNTGIVVTDVEGCFHNNFFKIKYDKQYFDKHFICQFLSSPMMQKRILSSAGSSTISDLSHKSFYKLDGFFPKIEEQKKISSFFNNLDNLITLHQRM
jgi:type I restriction enzyme S subunit